MKVFDGYTTHRLHYDQNDRYIYFVLIFRFNASTYSKPYQWFT